MKIPIRRSDGVAVCILFRALRIVGSPVNWLHEYLKRVLPNSSAANKLLPRWNLHERVGLVIETWGIGWTAVNTFVILPIIALGKGWLWWCCVGILASRTADFFQAFLGMNFQLLRVRQRSLARSFAMLFLALFEMAAISTSAQFIISDRFTVGNNESSKVYTVYYYSIRNMVTVGGDIAGSAPSPSLQAFFFGLVRLSQPLFSILLVTLAISQILNWKRSQRGQQNSA